ncbi:dUTP diphosphatase [Patescibacteria group bacterium]|nr:dUTP diphosphatase [Patescibacteria group bacterium]
MKVNFKKLNEEAITPNYAHLGDAGLDLYSLEDYSLKPGEIKTFFLGFALEFTKEYVALVNDKGGRANVDHLHTLGGVFDSSYRGEYNVCLTNLGKNIFEIKKGQKIAQLLIVPITQAQLEEVEILSDTSRKEGRFGSTGG